MDFKNKMRRLFQGKPQFEVCLSHLDEMAEMIEKNFIQAVSSNNTMEWVYIPDILYIDRDSNRATIRTFVDTYKREISYEMTQTVLKDYDFDVCDSRILVNLSKARKFNSSRGLIYFEDIVSEKSIYTTLSQRNISKFKKMLGEYNDLSLEKKPTGKFYQVRSI